MVHYNDVGRSMIRYHEKVEDEKYKLILKVREKRDTASEESFDYFQQLILSIQQANTLTEIDSCMRSVEEIMKY